MLPEPFKQWTRPFRVQKHLRKHLDIHEKKSENLKLILATRSSPNIVEFRREENRLILRTTDRLHFLDDRLFYYYRTQLPVMTRVVSGTLPSVQRVVCDISDGAREPSDRLLFSGSAPNALLVPDSEFYNSNAYAHVHAYKIGQRPWSERDQAFVWRGSTTGTEDHSFGSGIERLQRVRFCLMSREIPDTDCKISKITEPLDQHRDQLELSALEICGESVAERSWADRKFAFDIDGNTNAWSNFFVRMLLGCCVLKVDSPFGFRQWYYERLTPWTHFVPIKSDLSDLHQKIDWCRSNLGQCEEIASAAQRFSSQMTVHGEIASTIEIINQRLADKT